MQEYKILPVKSLILHPDNARQGNVDVIAESIKTNGFYGALIVQKSSNYVIAGNHRLLAAMTLEMDSVPCIVLDVPDSVARKILLADNRTSDLAVYDESALIDLLVELEGDISGTGYSESDIQELIDDLCLFDESKPTAQIKKTSPLLRLPVLIADVEMIEKAIVKTKLMRRSEAVAEIFRKYLDETAQ